MKDVKKHTVVFGLPAFLCALITCFVVSLTLGKYPVTQPEKPPAVSS